MKSLPIIAIVVLGLAAACAAKNDPGERPASTKPSPGPIAPDSWLINPPNQPAR
jgi:hypothetical protein